MFLKNIYKKKKKSSKIYIAHKNKEKITNRLKKYKTKKNHKNLKKKYIILLLNAFNFLIVCIYHVWLFNFFVINVQYLIYIQYV